MCSDNIGDFIEVYLLLFEGEVGTNCKVEFAETLIVGDGCSFIG